MFQLSQCHEPGLLLVLARPKAPEYIDEFHDWYNTEHGPARMKLNFIKNGYRYRTDDYESPTWAATYDVTRLSALTEPQYTNLRRFRSARELDVMENKIDICERKIYKLLLARGGSKEPAPVVLKFSLLVPTAHTTEAIQWHEHVSLLSSKRTHRSNDAQEHVAGALQVPGWRRSRLFKMIAGEQLHPGLVELMVIHEFDNVDRLGTLVQKYTQAPLPHAWPVLSEINRASLQLTFHHKFCAEDYRLPDKAMLPPQSISRPRAHEQQVEDLVVSKHNTDRFVVSTTVPVLAS